MFNLSFVEKRQFFQNGKIDWMGVRVLYFMQYNIRAHLVSILSVGLFCRYLHEGYIY